MNTPSRPPVRPASGRRRGPADATGGLVFSGLLVAVSFIALVIPLATYHLAQVAAALRTRTAVLLLLSVVGVCLLLGILLGVEAFLLGGLVGLFWAPLLAFSLYARSRNMAVLIPAAVFALPLTMLFTFTLATPTVPDLGSSLGNRLEAGLRDAGSFRNLPPAEAQDMARSARDGFQALRESREFDVLARAAALDPWQRLLWFVFGPGASLLLVFALMSIGNLLFLDVAFSQVERLRAVVRYVASRRANFPAEMVGGLSQMRMARGPSMGPLETGEGAPSPERPAEPAAPDPSGGGSNESSTGSSDPTGKGAGGARAPLRVVSHVKDAPLPENAPFWRRFVRQAQPREGVRLWGYLFRLEAPERRWNLKHFALPLGLVLAAIVFLGSLGFSAGDAEGVYARYEASRFLPLLGAGSILSFLLLCVLAVQGALVVYMRLAPVALLVALFVFLVIGSSGALNPLFVVAAFGALGLLDYLYDLRGGRQEPKGPSRAVPEGP